MVFIKDQNPQNTTSFPANFGVTLFQKMTINVKILTDREEAAVFFQVMKDMMSSVSHN